MASSLGSSPRPLEARSRSCSAAHICPLRYSSTHCWSVISQKPLYSWQGIGSRLDVPSVLLPLWALSSSRPQELPPSVSVVVTVKTTQVVSVSASHETCPAPLFPVEWDRASQRRSYKQQAHFLSARAALLLYAISALTKFKSKNTWRLGLVGFDCKDSVRFVS